jgi:hypothetical protein
VKNTNTTPWVRARFSKVQKRWTRLAAASDKAHQLLAQGRWFSPGISASSTTKTGRHDIAEILLKVALNTIKIKSNQNKTLQPTLGKQLVNFITCGCESNAPFFVIHKAGREPTPDWG